MGVLGCCCKYSVALAVVPLAVFLAVLFEEPVVLELKADLVTGASAEGGAVPPSSEPVETKEEKGPGTEFGKAVPEGMGSGGMFDRIAFVYDSTNKWMSLGLDQHWRRTLIKDCLHLELGDHVLDLATGTADVSLLVADRLKELGALSGEGSVGEVLGVDPSPEMLRRGVAKAEARGLSGLVRLVKGDAQNLGSVQNISVEGTLSEPLAGLADASKDKISMSFGIRNVPDRARAFREMKRVLKKKPSSRVCILEFSLPDGEKLLSQIAKAFITKAVPFIGRVATLNSGGQEYEYLERSILKFPKPLDFAASMTREGLPVSSITSFAFGAVHLYAASPAP